MVVASDHQPDSGDGRAGLCGVAERPVVVMNPGNTGGAKGLDFCHVSGRDQEPEIGEAISSIK